MNYNIRYYAIMIINKSLYLIILLLLTFTWWMYWTSKLTYTSSFLVLQKFQYPEKYLMTPQNVCSKNPYVLLMVTSYVGHVKLRNAHRRAMTPNYLKSKNAIRVFLLAKIPQQEKSIIQDAIELENYMYGDILQGSFNENYRNLTYKHLMGLKWASTECGNASFIIKLDDDIVFNLKKTFELLEMLKSADKENLLMGKVLTELEVKRKADDKWYVTYDEFKRSIYPPFLSGWFYVTTPKVAARLVKEAVNHPYFWIDDVFVTGLLTETLGIKLQNVPLGFWMDYYEIVECCMRDMLRKNIKCDHAVGPNGQRDDLIVEFNRAFKICSRRKECQSNDDYKSCVLWKDREIFSEGKGEIKLVKFKR